VPEIDHFPVDKIFLPDNLIVVKKLPEVLLFSQVGCGYNQPNCFDRRRRVRRPHPAIIGIDRLQKKKTLLEKPGLFLLRER